VRVMDTTIADILFLHPNVFCDPRGFFFESYNQNELATGGIHHCFGQDNPSGSRKNVLRGLHYQINQPQGTPVRVVVGEVSEIEVDSRGDSATFGGWLGVDLSAENNEMLWAPSEFGRAFLQPFD
jgi:dTDP-4-dehydrorhamnose 3,5-epimerase